MNIKELIDYGKNKLDEKNIIDSNIIAKMLAEYVLSMSKTELVISMENQIDESAFINYNMNLTEVLNGKPVQYVIGKQEFYGEEFYVNENVLIPQPDTEILVEEVLNIIKDNGFERILDICTGSGCIGLTIAKNIPYTKVSLLDIDRLVLEVAKINSQRLNVNNVELIESDMFEELEEEYDVIVSNPPYIKTEEIGKLDVQVQNEPVLALDGGEDGLEYYKILIEEAHKYLSDDGYLCLEIGYDQKDEVLSLIEENGNYKNVYSKKDLGGNDRIIIMQRR